MSEDYPRLVLTRRVIKGKDLYFGPYPKSSIVKHLMRFLWKSKYAPLRPCKWSFSRQKPLAPLKINTCIYYHTGQCPAPCAGKISYPDYRALVQRMADFLDGNYGTWVDEGVDYIRLQEVRLNYTVPSSFLEKVTNGLVSRASVYVSANDLFTITNYAGVNPVGNSSSAAAGGSGGTGIDSWGLPSPRTYTCGLSVTF